MQNERNYGSWSLEGKAIYDYADPYCEGLSFVEKNYKQSFIDHDGRVVIRHSSKRAPEPPCRCGRILFATRSGYGFLNNKGKVAISPKHIHAEGFFNGRCIVADENQRFGVIGLDGETIVHMEYDFIDNFSCGLAYFNRNGHAGYMDINGNVVIPPDLICASKFKDGFARVLRKGRKCHSIIDIYDREQFSTRRFQSIENFSETLAAVKIKDLWGFVDVAGDLVIEPKYLRVTDFSGGLAAVQCDNNHWGFIDARGKMVINPSFSEARAYSESLAAVRRMHEWGFIDKTGKYIVEPQFMEVSDVSEDVAVVSVYSGMRFLKFM